MVLGLSIPTDTKKIAAFALDLAQQCRSSAGQRAALCRQLNTVVETGKSDGSRSLINMLYRLLDKTAAHLYSPTDLRFSIDFENDYPREMIDKAKMASRVLTRDWERTNTDVLFGQGVFEALKYGAAVLKQWPQQEGPDRTTVYKRRLVMPWQFAVYREDVNDLSEQPVMCETSMLSLPELWRRVYHLPNRYEIMRKAKQSAHKGIGSDDTHNSFFHQVLSTATLNTSATSSTPRAPGGIVALSNDPGSMVMAPSSDIELVKFHELWVWHETDYATIQLIEPDILIAPLFKRSNLLISGDEQSGLHPYTLIQPNIVPGYIWGRSELTDVIMPQSLLSEWAADAQRLFGLQVDKILAFQGSDNITDELYGQFRNAGYVNMGPGGTVTDLTPQMPSNMLQMLQMAIQIIEKLSGFDNIMSGGGEPGVRSAQQTSMLMKTASPQLRDRSLLVERQCATAADLRLHLMEAKDGRRYWTDPNKPEESSFILHDIPEDRRVVVDSHSSSPIFRDDHAQLVAFGMKAGIVDAESAIEMLDYPQKDLLIQRYRERQQAQQKMMADLRERDPEAFAKVLARKR